MAACKLLKRMDCAIEMLSDVHKSAAPLKGLVLDYEVVCRAFIMSKRRLWLWTGNNPNAHRVPLGQHGSCGKSIGNVLLRRRVGSTSNVVSIVVRVVLWCPLLSALLVHWLSSQWRLVTCKNNWFLFGGGCRHKYTF